MRFSWLRLAIVVLLAFAVGFFWWNIRRHSAVIDNADELESKSGSAAIKSPPNVSASHGILRPTLSPALLAPPSPERMRQTVAENAVPGRMVFLDFVITRDGLRWVGATGASGRAKPRVVQTGFGFVRFEVFDRGGRMTLAGSEPDPTRRRLEYPAAGDDGRIATKVISSAEGAFAVRLPGEVDAARIVFFREKEPRSPAASSNGADREILGDFSLRNGP
jgi:hypothetical protein